MDDLHLSGLRGSCRSGNLDDEEEDEEESLPKAGHDSSGKDANKRRRVSDEGPAAEGGLEAGALAIGMDFDLDVDLPSTQAPAANGMSLGLITACTNLSWLGFLTEAFTAIETINGVDCDRSAFCLEFSC